jgi:hypothetical protein
LSPAKDWLPADDIAHFIAAADRLRLAALHTSSAAAEDPEHENGKAAYEGRKAAATGPKPPGDSPPAARRSNLDSRLTCESNARKRRRACKAPAAVCAEGSRPVLATNPAAPGRALLAG